MSEHATLHRHVLWIWVFDPYIFHYYCYCCYYICCCCCYHHRLNPLIGNKNGNPCVGSFLIESVPLTKTFQSLSLGVYECLNSLRINENVWEIEMKNHDYVLHIDFCPKRTNEWTKMVRADKMDEPVDYLPASDHLLAWLSATLLACFAWFLIKDAW